MISHEEFRFQRHLELWKDQNRSIKRVIVLILLFGFLVLFRVLIPFAEKTELIGQQIQAKQEAKADIEAKNKVISRLEDKLAEVKKVIAEQPWMEEKNALIRTFVQMRNTGRANNAQAEADKTIRAITQSVRGDIVDPLVGELDANPEIAAKMPDLMESVGVLKDIVNQWEADRVGRRWFRTLEAKSREMRELTTALDAQTRDVSNVLARTIMTLKAQIKSGDQEIAALTDAIEEANNQLKDILDQLFPKWMKGIINIEQMTQIFPIILILLLLYMAWTVGSMSHHYHYVAKQLKFEEDDKTDVATTSLWTLADKSLRGRLMTMVIYCLFVLIVWVFFEKGTDLLNWWIPLAKPEELFINATAASAVQWTGRIMFSAMIALVLLHRRIVLYGNR